MRRRYLVWPIVGVWLVAAFFVLRGREVRDDAVAITRTVAEASDSWWREDRYYDRANNARATLVQRPQSGEETYENPERIRVLLIGDSFTYGTGLRDMDRRLGSILETMLDDATAEGTFEVVTVAYPGASTFTQASWLRKAREGARLSDFLPEQRIGNAAKLHGPFDVLMVGYVENDVFPDGRDAKLDIPEEYHAEVRHTHTARQRFWNDTWTCTRTSRTKAGCYTTSYETVRPHRTTPIIQWRCGTFARSSATTPR